MFVTEICAIIFFISPVTGICVQSCVELLNKAHFDVFYEQRSTYFSNTGIRQANNYLQVSLSFFIFALTRDNVVCEFTISLHEADDFLSCSSLSSRPRMNSNTQLQGSFLRYIFSL